MQNSSFFSAEFIVFSAEFIVFSAEFIVFNANRYLHRVERHEDPLPIERRDKINPVITNERASWCENDHFENILIKTMRILSKRWECCHRFDYQIIAFELVWSRHFNHKIVVLIIKSSCFVHEIVILIMESSLFYCKKRTRTSRSCTSRWSFSDEFPPENGRTRTHSQCVKERYPRITLWWDCGAQGVDDICIPGISLGIILWWGWFLCSSRASAAHSLL